MLEALGPTDALDRALDPLLELDGADGSTTTDQLLDALGGALGDFGLSGPIE
jgi:hypothetical protein